LKHGEKNFVCSFPGCNRAFATFTQVKQHEKAFLYHQRNIVRDSSLENLKNDQVYFLDEILPNFNKTDSDKSQSKNSPTSVPNSNETAVTVAEQEEVEVENSSQNNLAPEITQNSSKAPENNFDEQCLMTLIKKVFRENKVLHKQLQETEQKIVQINKKDEVTVDSFFNLSSTSPQNKNQNQEEAPLDYSLNLGEWDFLRRETK